MATTTRVLDANVNGTVYTSNANSALEALDTCHSGATAPTDEVANGKLWLDTSTTPGILKIYNNATWEVVGKHWTPSIDDNATSTAMTLDGGGNVLVGKTSAAGQSTTGIEARSDGVLIATKAGVVQYLNRTGSDGTILNIAKDGTTVGSIGSLGGDMVLGTGDVGFRFDDGSDVVTPWNISTNSARNSAIDLGHSTAKFKDLYLSGGVYLGGTGAANKLDDYEEGTFTITCNVGTCNSARAMYTKVGDLVTIIANVNTFSNTGIASQVILLGLPFAVFGEGVGVFMAKGMTQTTEHAVFAVNTNLSFYGTYSGASYDPLLYTDMTADSEFYLSVTYKTTQ